jgi:S1-C subfamily serine protease
MRFLKTLTFLMLATGLVFALSAWAQNTLRQSIPGIARDATGAVVSIVMSDKAGQPISQGSGFLISADGRVVTNYHVIKSGISAVIKLPNGAFFVVDGVFAFDKDHDVAIIKAHGNDFHTVRLGDSDRLQAGSHGQRFSDRGLFSCAIPNGNRR